MTIDFVDIDGGYRISQRHFHSYPKQMNLCCFDGAWLPGSGLDDRIQFGPMVNFGGWNQSMESGPKVAVVDLLMGGTITTKNLGITQGPWGRFDLGLAMLTVSRRTVGTDIGIGGGVRAGWSFPMNGYSFFAGAGVDTRRYLHLNVQDVPAVTLFAGVAL